MCSGSDVFTEIILASRTKDKCDRIADMLDREIITEELDADNVAITIGHLIKILSDFKRKYDNADIYFEPGKAVALHSGVLVTTVLDIVNNGMDIAIFDTSATCHMPDVIEMSYRPHVLGSGKVGEKKVSYRLAGVSCLAGDIIGDYSFDKKLSVGGRLIFCDMSIYSIVKTTTL